MNKPHTLPAIFYWLNAAQFLGAFNDNLFKLLVIFQLITLKGAEHIVSISAIAGTIFVLPFILFAPLAGLCADRFPKHQVLFLGKSAEVIIMIIGTFFFCF